MRSGFSSIFAVPSELLIETGNAPPLLAESFAPSFSSPSEEQPTRATARATVVAVAAMVWRRTRVKPSMEGPQVGRAVKVRQA